MTTTITLDQRWECVNSALAKATAISFDGCHKIYVLLDDHQADYQAALDYPFMVFASETTRPEMLATLKEWFDASCGLRFISAVRTVGGDPNDGFDDLIPQGADWDDQ